MVNKCVYNLLIQMAREWLSVLNSTFTFNSINFVSSNEWKTSNIYLCHHAINVSISSKLHNRKLFWFSVWFDRNEFDSDNYVNLNTQNFNQVKIVLTTRCVFTLNEEEKYFHYVNWIQWISSIVSAQTFHSMGLYVRSTNYLFAHSMFVTLDHQEKCRLTTSKMESHAIEQSGTMHDSVFIDRFEHHLSSRRWIFQSKLHLLR